MNTQVYLKELEKKLQVLDKSKRDEIIKEIHSYISEEDIDYDTLVSKFGPASSLAESYLEDIPVEKREIPKKWYQKKRTYIFSFIALLFLPIFYVYNMMQDPFDYSKYNANTIKEKVQTTWNKVEDITSINTMQSRVIVYINDQNYLEYSCEESHPKKVQNKLEVIQSACILLVPNSITDIKSVQSSLTIVDLKQKLDLDLEQTSLGIAKNSTSFKYEIDKQQSSFDLESKESDIVISMKLNQSSVEYYSY